MDQPVYQKGNNDCAIACLAMMCGVSYEMVYLAYYETYGRVLLENQEGVLLKDIPEIAKRLGVKIRIKEERPLFSFKRKMVLVVPGAKDPKCNHAVYYDGQRILDPNPIPRNQTTDDFLKSVRAYVYRTWF